MKNIFEGIPWSKKEVTANLIAIFTLLVYGSIIILLKNWFGLIIFWIFWVLYLVVGRYVTCRHCDYLGKACCSWCVGIVGGKLYKRSKLRSFPEAGLWKMLIFDVLWLALATITPYVLYAYYFFTEGLPLIDWILLGIYTVIGFITLGIHNRGCKKCPITGCPLSGQRKKQHNTELQGE